MQLEDALVLTHRAEEEDVQSRTSTEISLTYSAVLLPMNTIAMAVAYAFCGNDDEREDSCSLTFPQWLHVSINALKPFQAIGSPKGRAVGVRGVLYISGYGAEKIDAACTLLYVDGKWIPRTVEFRFELAGEKITRTYRCESIGAPDRWRFKEVKLTSK